MKLELQKVKHIENITSHQDLTDALQNNWRKLEVISNRKRPFSDIIISKQNSIQIAMLYNLNYPLKSSSNYIASLFELNFVLVLLMSDLQLLLYNLNYPLKGSSNYIASLFEMNFVLRLIRLAILMSSASSLWF